MDSEDKGAFLKSLSPSDAANLASFMRRKHQDDQANVERDIAEEVQVRAFRLGPVERNRLRTLTCSPLLSLSFEQERCPPRQVRSFRVAHIRDAQTSKPALRKGQLTLWDAVQLGDDSLEEGKRYLVRPSFALFFSLQRQKLIIFWV